MPHKRNPVLSENVTGLARMVRAYVTPALENVALWHERDISHSSVERMIGPDATATLDFALARLAGIIDKLVVYPDTMQKNLDRLGGLVHSQRVLIALTQKGVAREEAYRLVQRNAMKVWGGESDFLSLLKADKDVRKHFERGRAQSQFRSRLSLQARRHDLRPRVRQGGLRPAGARRERPTSARLRFRPGRAHGLSRGRGRAAARPLCSMSPTTRFFPTAAATKRALIARVIELMGELIATHRPDLVIIACNTASTLVLPQLRARFRGALHRHGAGHQAGLRASVSKRVSVLGTQATIAREYTRALIRDFANGADITLVGSGALAALAEAQLRGEAVADAAIAAELAPCFVDADGRRTDTVVLACTHYPLLHRPAHRARALAGAVHRSGPGDRPAGSRAHGAARGRHGTPPGPQPAAKGQILFTSGRPPSPALAAALAGFGLGGTAPDGGCPAAV